MIVLVDIITENKFACVSAGIVNEAGQLSFDSTVHFSHYVPNNNTKYHIDEVINKLLKHLPSHPKAIIFDYEYAVEANKSKDLIFDKPIAYIGLSSESIGKNFIELHGKTFSLTHGPYHKDIANLITEKLDYQESEFSLLKNCKELNLKNNTGNLESCYKDFWKEYKERLHYIVKNDFNRNLIANHEKLLPTLEHSEVLKIEEQLKVKLPIEVKTFLMCFSAGHIGPYGGLYNLKETFMTYEYKNGDFDETGFNPMEDNIEDRPGIIPIAGDGYAGQIYLEIEGDNPGNLWGAGDYIDSQGNFLNYFKKWLDGKYNIIERSEIMIEVFKRFKAGEKYDLYQLMEIFNRNFEYHKRENSDSYVSFKDVSGAIYLDDNNQVTKFDLTHKYSYQY